MEIQPGFWRPFGDSGGMVEYSIAKANHILQLITERIAEYDEEIEPGLRHAIAEECYRNEAVWYSLPDECVVFNPQVMALEGTGMPNYHIDLSLQAISAVIDHYLFYSASEATSGDQNVTGSVKVRWGLQEFVSKDGVEIAYKDWLNEAAKALLVFDISQRILPSNLLEAVNRQNGNSNDILKALTKLYATISYLGDGNQDNEPNDLSKDLLNGAKEALFFGKKKKFGDSIYRSIKFLCGQRILSKQYGLISALKERDFDTLCDFSEEMDEFQIHAGV